MKQSELVKVASEKAGVSQKDTDKVLHAIFETLADDMVSGDSTNIKGFGTFGTRVSKERRLRNVISKEIQIVPSKVRPKVTFSKILSNRL